jgi:hypothetical protein
MDDAASPTADFYRGKAEQIRLHAGRVRTLDVALELLDMPIVLSGRQRMSRGDHFVSLAEQRRQQRPY